MAVDHDLMNNSGSNSPKSLENRKIRCYMSKNLINIVVATAVEEQTTIEEVA